MPTTTLMLPDRKEIMTERKLDEKTQQSLEIKIFHFQNLYRNIKPREHTSRTPPVVLEGA